MRAQAPPPSSSPTSTPPTQTRSSNGLFLRYAGAFVAGLLVGWLLLGWHLFPKTPSDVTPSQLRADIQDDYILMTAEAYAATHDLRTAAKRLRFWSPETAAQRVNQIALALEKIDPERSAYMRLLARDLHLDRTSPAPSTPPQEGLPILSVAGLLAFLTLSGLILYLVRRKGLLARPREVAPEHPPADAREQDQPVHIMPLSPARPAPPAASIKEEEEAREGAFPAGKYAFSPLPERESVWAREARGQTGALAAQKKTPWQAELEEEALEGPPDAYDAPIAAPEDFSTVPAPPPAPEDEEAMELREGEGAPDSASTSQTLQFDGSPDYNAIAPIEIGEDFGQFVLGVALTAPSNPKQVLALEALLYDRNDIRAVTALLAPPTLANDPELMAAYFVPPPDEDRQVIPLQPGATFRLETTYLAVEGKVRRVQFGPRTGDGVPVIEFAEIEFTPQRAGGGF